MAEPEIKYLGDLQRLDLKPGDRFILTVPRPISAPQAEHIQKAWKNFVGGDHESLKLLILEEGMKVGVINGSEAA